jgi:hypothetical protein
VAQATLLKILLVIFFRPIEGRCRQYLGNDRSPVLAGMLQLLFGFFGSYLVD